MCRGAYDVGRITVLLGAGDDRLAGDRSFEYETLSVQAGSGADAVTLPAGRAELDGGPGDDVLTASGELSILRGGRGADVLRGGPAYIQLEGDPPSGPFSADRLEGGTGGGVALYTARAAPVVVDLGDPGADGSAGEGDVLTGVADVMGGRGPDVLRGGGGRNSLKGARGNDVVDGRGGGDEVAGGAGRDRLTGGPGDDYLDAGPHDFRLEGGSGDDRLSLVDRIRPLERAALPEIDCAGGTDLIFGLPPGATVDRGCERLSLASLTAALDLSTLARGHVGVRLTMDGSALPYCHVRVHLRAVGRPATTTAVRRPMDRRGRARIRIPLPPPLRRALRRRDARLDVRVDGSETCRKRRFRPAGHYRVAL